jgi:hypothetical protein
MPPAKNCDGGCVQRALNSFTGLSSDQVITNPAIKKDRHTDSTQPADAYLIDSFSPVAHECVLWL